MYIKSLYVTCTTLRLVKKVLIYRVYPLGPYTKCFKFSLLTLKYVWDYAVVECTSIGPVDMWLA